MYHICPLSLKTIPRLSINCLQCVYIQILKVNNYQLILASAGEISSLFGHNCTHNVYTTDNKRQRERKKNNVC